MKSLKVTFGSISKKDSVMRFVDPCILRICYCEGLGTYSRLIVKSANSFDILFRTIGYIVRFSK